MMPNKEKLLAWIERDKELLREVDALPNPEQANFKKLANHIRSEPSSYYSDTTDIEDSMLGALKWRECYLKTSSSDSKWDAMLRDRTLAGWYEFNYSKTIGDSQPTETELLDDKLADLEDPENPSDEELEPIVKFLMRTSGYRVLRYSDPETIVWQAIRMRLAVIRETEKSYSLTTQEYTKAADKHMHDWMLDSLVSLGYINLPGTEIASDSSSTTI